MDFTILIYRNLLTALSNQGFSFYTVRDLTTNPDYRTIFLRHDVDRLPLNSQIFAETQNKLGIKGTYFFRNIPESFNEGIIRKISESGHEIGYHYEDLSFAGAKLKVQGSRFKVQGEELEKKLTEIAIESFSKNLEKLRKIVPVKTICMHGSPMSGWDSRLLWKYYDYHDFGIIGEPYFDIDFDRVLYLTDTGRRWDGEVVSVRDKMLGGDEWEKGRLGDGGKEYDFSDWKVKPFKYRQLTQERGPSTQPASRSFSEGGDPAPSTQRPATSNQQPATFPNLHSTSDIIKAVNEGRLPDKVMMTFHPQRWTDRPIPWVKELVWQNVKNVAKYFIVKVNGEK